MGKDLDIKNISDGGLEKVVFKYTSSDSDKRFFKKRIVDFLQSDRSKTYSQWMYEAVWERNDQGTLTKYCYFSEYQQRVFLDKYFYEWITRMIKKAEAELEKIPK